MEISSMTSRFGLETRMLAAAVASPSRTTTTTNSRRTLNVSAKFSTGTSLTSSHVAPLFGGSVTADFSSQSIRPSPLSTSSSFSSSGVKRNVITMVIPFIRGHAREQPPPDLASYLFKNRIIYLGMCLVPAVTELMIAELMYLSDDNPTKPIYLYINSTGTTRGDAELGYDAEAFAVYDYMGYTKAPVFTLAVGNAWGEAALLLAAGKLGNRAALPSATIMMKQPYGRVQGQAIDVENVRKSIRKVKEELVELFSRHTGIAEEHIEELIRRRKYFSPSEAVEYGIIDKVLYNERATKDRGVASELNKD